MAEKNDKKQKNDDTFSVGVDAVVIRVILNSPYGYLTCGKEILKNGAIGEVHGKILNGYNNVIFNGIERRVPCHWITPV